ncbi:MAG: T9SS type A sorting domain-containing protein [Ignavibacteriaceae bacterium]
MNMFRLFPLLPVMIFVFSIFLYSQSTILDNTFGTDGTVRNYITGGDSDADVATSIAIQPDGKLVVAGQSAGPSALTNFFAVARYNSNGTPDSTFGGTGWIAVNNELPSNVSSLVVIGGNLYAGTNDQGIFLSTDNGASWNAINNGLTDSSVTSFVNNGNNVFAGTLGGGIFLSTDNGASWNAVNNGLTDLNVFALAVRGNNIFAGTNNSGVFLSTDNGTSWNDVSHGITNAVIKSFAFIGNNIFAKTFTDVFLSTDNGTSWQTVNTGLANDNINCIAVKNGNLFVGTGNNGVFVSSDTGASWHQANTGLTDTWINGLAVNGDNLFAGTDSDGVAGVFASSDNGVSWHKFNTRLNAHTVFSIAFLGNNIFAVTTNGVFKSTLSNGFILAGGDDWAAASVLIQTDGKIVVAGSADVSPSGYASNNSYEFGLYRFNSNGTLDSTFGQFGQTRTAIFGGDSTTDHVYAAALQGDGKIIVAGASADSSKTAFALARFNSDGTIDKSFGTNGTVRNYIATADSFDDEAHSVAVQSDGKIVAAGWSLDPYAATPQTFALARYNSNGTLDNTFGSGGTVRVPVPVPGISNEQGLAYSVAILPDGKILAGGYSDDSGFTAIRFKNDGTIDNTFGIMGAATTHISGSNTDDHAHSMAVGSDGQIALAGHSSMPGNGGDAFSVACFDSNGSIEKAFGTNGSMVANISGGDGNDDEANAVAIQSDGRIVAAGYSEGAPPYLGSIGWAFALARFLPGIPTSVPSKVLVPMEYTLYQNYPNPFNPSTIISYQLPVSSKVVLKIYDLLGRDVATLVNKEQVTGNYKVIFNGNNLASGVYFYRLKAGNFVETKKLILMK